MPSTARRHLRRTAGACRNRRKSLLSLLCLLRSQSPTAETLNSNRKALGVCIGVAMHYAATCRPLKEFVFQQLQQNAAIEV
jgi:hypothetical protein